jgi:hypothetical protein
MSQILVRFLIGGMVVSAFAILADMLKPKSFAGLFGAAPSVALATPGSHRRQRRSPVCRARGALHDSGSHRIFCVRLPGESIMTRYRLKSVLVALCSIPLWAGMAFAVWTVCLN